jgi:hypothetical protein
MICENCQKEFSSKVRYGDFTVLCAACKNAETIEEEETLAEHMNKLIDRVADGLTFIDEEDEDVT